ncbi:2Fe-2S iron-sulfur cluster-binding protein [Holospora curviuscula]|uniref:Ferredoxin-6 n=1 Tax=Holospora curviuscula TaxID=1082868 RepID=A0A2S5R8T9_9PROT|nr:2Fe-2S iron-sulfur cluster-binding protein [Holospora curviuscula]PPE03592.1 Ferredoxin-6 [Holospora curviuscula]
MSTKQSFKEEHIQILFCNAQGKEVSVLGEVGKTIFEVFNDHRELLEAQDIDLEGACGGACACATCHVIIQDETLFHLLPDASVQEEDMLDLAYDVRRTSRLGCQVTLTKDLDGIRVLCPTETRHLKI